MLGVSSASLLSPVNWVMWGFDAPPTTVPAAVWLLAGIVGVPIGQQALVGAFPCEKASILHFLPRLHSPLWPEGVDRERQHEGSPEWGASEQLTGPHEALDAASVQRCQESSPDLSRAPWALHHLSKPRASLSTPGPQVVLSVRWGLCRPQGGRGAEGRVTTACGGLK